MKNGSLLFRNFTPYITSSFGYRLNPITGEYANHLGVDYGTNSQKLPTYAIENGIVLKTGYSSISGNFVYINYERLGKIALYQHLDRISVQNGQKVDNNTIVGYVGETGQVTGIHLHFGWFNESEYNKGWYERNWEDFEKYEYIKELERIGEPVSIDKNVDQIEVLIDNLRVRKTANGDIIGYIKRGIYSILETEVDENYIWYKIGDDMWIAYSSSWANILNKDIKIDEVEVEDNEVIDSNEDVSKKKNIFQIIYQSFLNFFIKIINFITNQKNK